MNSKAFTLRHITAISGRVMKNIFCTKWTQGEARAGFTAVEALLTIGVIAITAGLSVPMYRNYQIRSDLDLAIEQTLHGLGQAQLRSRSGELDSTWGFRVAEGTVFQGEAYEVRNEESDQIISLPSTITVLGINEVVFERVTGNPNVTGDIILEALNGQQRIVTVRSDGTFDTSDLITPDIGDEGGDSSEDSSEGEEEEDSSSSAGGSQESTGSTESTGSEGSTASQGSAASSTAGTQTSSEGTQSSAGTTSSETGGGGTSSSQGSACTDRFAVDSDGTIETTGSVNATFRALGSAITYGAGGPEVQVTAEVSSDGGETWQSLFSGAEIDGGEEQVVNGLYSGQQILVRVNGRYGWLFNKTFTSNDDSGHIEVLRNGDDPPEYQAFDNQSGLQDFLDNIIDINGKISIGSYDAVLLVELGTLNSSSADFQDAVILVKFEQPTGTCASPSEPRFKVEIDRLENSGTGDAKPVVYVGQNALGYKAGDWVPLRNAGVAITDTGLVETVKGLAAQRGSGFVRILLHGSHSGGGSKEIVDARIIFENASITQVQNDTGSNAAEDPFNSVVNDGSGGDEATTAVDSTSVLFQTRVTSEDDAILIYWQPVAASSSSSVSSTSSSTSSTSSSSSSVNLEDTTADPCGAGYAIENGRIILSETADVSFKVLGTFATYGERGPAIQMRLSASTNGGSTWKSLYGYRAIAGNESESFFDVPSGSRIILRAEGRRSWLFRESAQSDDGTNRILLLQRGADDPNTTIFTNPGNLKQFLRSKLTGRRIAIGKTELLALVELQGVGANADYQDAVVLMYIEKPACRAASVVNSSSSSSVSSNAASTSSTSSASSSSSSGSPETQVTICHFPPGNPRNFSNLTVGQSAVDSHLAHGDRLGTCTGDFDGDGIATSEDLCPDTYMPEPVPTEQMLFDRYALTKNSYIFRVGPRKKVSEYTLIDTRGCSCEQLIDVAESKRDYYFGLHPRLLRNMRGLFPFYTNGARQFGCGEAILKMVRGS